MDQIPSKIREIIARYISALKENRISVDQAVVFGSYAKGNSNVNRGRCFVLRQSLEIKSLTEPAKHTEKTKNSVISVPAPPALWNAKPIPLE